MRTIELSYQAESLYLKANPDQKRRLIKSVLSNCVLKDATLYPTYNKAFNVMAEGLVFNNKRAVADDIRTYLDPLDEIYITNLNTKILSLVG